MTYSINADSIAGVCAELVRQMQAQNTSARRIDSGRFVCADGSTVTIVLRDPKKKAKKPPRKVGDVKIVKGVRYVCRQDFSEREHAYLVDSRGRPQLHWAKEEAKATA